MRYPILPTAFLVALAASGLHAGEIPFQLKREGTFPLDAKLTTPPGKTLRKIERLVILLHGSGPNDMDEDLSGATADGSELKFFAELARVLVPRGFAVLRYHKRSYQARLLAQEDPAFLESPEFAALDAHPYRHFVDDARMAVTWAREHLPGAGVYLVGHSQGCDVAMHAAHGYDDVAGLGMIGFSLQPIQVSFFEQVVYRPLGKVRPLDTDHDGLLGEEELAGTNSIAQAIRRQREVLDADGDGAVSMDELKAGNLSNWVIAPGSVRGLRKLAIDEATYPSAAEILHDIEIPVAFLQGEWDNQTPAYNARAVQMAVEHHLEGKRMVFRFYPRCGHALDPRHSYEDIAYRRPAEETLQDVARTLDRAFR